MNTHVNKTQEKPILIIVLVVALIIVVHGIYIRWSNSQELNKQVQEQIIRTVSITSPTIIENSQLQFSGRIEAWSQTPLYARVGGYLKKWNVDIGDQVKKGQVLAEIDTPELDQEILQAQAQLAEARTEADFAMTTAKRWQSLAHSNSVSSQEVAEREADKNAKIAAMNALQANFNRLRTMQTYKRITAPFDGIITVRNTDIGALINTGMATDNELFVISDIQKLRIYAEIPQRQISFIQVGTTADLTVPEYPNEIFSATVSSLSKAINPTTGSMQVQLTVQNKDQHLLPGAYANLSFKLVESSDNPGIPPSALIINKNGVQIAIINDKNQIQLKQIKVIQDFGNQVEITGDITLKDRIVTNPPDGVENGDQVRIAVSNHH
ncbi:efflux RND transporter periplasmic adaptor subunit [Acinetobacter puyangensis]|uniref:RND family efflux transporter, MFP subunit n=1 Tax=Acinetobacter puyangensis TaxID=1096779 RepID=A0A240E8S5_9GAMM|nr:efflux RND transporter periplasmic adaptor subunit [Acinetobacter puyangensis]SNX44315.1 RND family efflux transporter, MFP subunit [Acinetobacter puyangensis]